MTNAVPLLSVDEIDRHIGIQIRLFRKKRGISLQSLGRAIGVTYQQIQKYENGSNRVSASMLLRIMAYLDVDPIEVFRGLPQPGLVGEDGSAICADDDIEAKIARLPAKVQNSVLALIMAIDQQHG